RLAGRQAAVQEQIRDLLIRDGAGQVLDGVAAIVQPALALAPLQVADGRLGRDDPLDARVVMLRRRGTHERLAPPRGSGSTRDLTIETSPVSPRRRARPGG